MRTRKEKIDNQIRARQAMLLDFFDKEFWGFDGHNKVEFFTLETFMERILERYEVENLSEEQIEEIARSVFDMMEKDYNIIKTVQSQGEIVYAINAEKIKHIKNPADALFCCERD